MKKIIALLLAAIMLVACFAGFAGCKKDETHNFNIYCWNEEFKGFFEKYYTVPEGVTVNWIINPSDGGVYQQKLDEALLAQADADDNDKIDMFLAEADYIQKYVDSDATMDIAEIGYTCADTMYDYTIKAATDTRNGKVKGVSFQCCPAALIYRRSIAKDVIGSDDPADVQAALDSWEKFEAVAKDAKAKGYYMTASFAETYRTFSNNCTTAWVDASNNLVFDEGIVSWIEQTKEFVDKGYTLTAGVWDDEKNQQMFATGKTMCFFGPAWYFNFSMGNAHDETNGCSGDWAIVQGPQAYFWGGTWLLAATGSDDKDMLKDIFEAFTINEEICTNLIKNEAQFTNNKKVNEAVANDATYGSAFLGGQNDVAVFVGMADGIKWENHTMYDQLLNEGLQTYMKDFFTGAVDYETAMGNYFNYVKETYATINVPAAAPEIEVAAPIDPNAEYDAFIAFGGDAAAENDWGFQYYGDGAASNAGEITATNAKIKVGDTVTLKLEFATPCVNPWFFAPCLILDATDRTVDATVVCRIDGAEVAIDLAADAEGKTFWYEGTGDYTAEQCVRLAGGFNEWATKYIAEPANFTTIEYDITLNAIA